jgi:hypothetical protein
MSLLATASNWTNDDGPPKKRTSTLRNLSNTTMNPSSAGLSDSSGSSSFISSGDLSTYNDETNKRNAKVNDVITQMTTVTEDNDGSRLANFVPLPNPATTINKDLPPIIVSKADQYSMFNPSSNSGTFGATQQNGPYSNYQASYQNKPFSPNYGPNINGINNAGSIDSKVMEKINYMIHMLEQQQNEKTANITEEFILYTFLGVFIIFVVDSFSRTGKYIR